MSKNAWYASTRTQFLASETGHVVGQLSSAAVDEGWHVEEAQKQEWEQTVKILRGGPSSARVSEGVRVLKGVLSRSELAEFDYVILEYDFRRRGLRIDCVLLAPGLIVVIEFKRSRITAGDRDQAASYAINLVEFHKMTQSLAGDVLIAPMVALTRGVLPEKRALSGKLHADPWKGVLQTPAEADQTTLASVLSRLLKLRVKKEKISGARWVNSPFSPSSTILDAAISLYGCHEVSAIKEHAAPARAIRLCTREILSQIRAARKAGRNRVVLVSGAPGAGKTLVGLDVAFSSEFRRDSVFVTGNVPLIKVLNTALKYSYRSTPRAEEAIVASGYPGTHARQVIDAAASFKLVAAHQFLGERGTVLSGTDGGVIVLDEAQRTYEKGKEVGGNRLQDHEADLIMKSVERTHPSGSVIVGLLGHNQFINTRERGGGAWLDAAERRGWDVAIADETLELEELAPHLRWKRAPGRARLKHGHLRHSMRFYRNAGIERWAHALLENDVKAALKIARELRRAGHTIQVTRRLTDAKRWARTQRVGDQRAGLVASGQAKRLIAVGLYPNHKPPVDHWMLAPSDDCRSSNMLETVQNQYQIQGLELDYVVLCWGADLRRRSGDWAAFKMSGNRWNNDRHIDIAKNGYRVLLTRARRGMVIFVPRGDVSGGDETRRPAFYDGVAEFLQRSGAEGLA